MTSPDPLYAETRPLRVAIPTTGRQARAAHPAATVARSLAAVAAQAATRARDLLLQVAGMALIAYGLSLVYRPAGFIAAGLAVLYLHWLATTDPQPAVEPPPDPDA